MNAPLLLEQLLSHLGVFAVFVVVAILAWNLWVTYINMLYLRSVDWVLLEIVPPKEVHKSPEAMELVLNVFNGGGAGNWYEKYWKGELAQYYSLEIVSTEGKIHFYVRFAKKFKKAFEAQLYAQYPQAEIKEVEDYTKKIPSFTSGLIGMFAYNLKLKKEDPYPIKSYIDFGLDRAVGSLDEEQRIDPITPTLETMGSIGVGEHIWVQINFRQAIKRHEVKNAKKEIEKDKAWTDKSKEIIATLKAAANTKDENDKVVVGRLSKGENQVIEAIERHRNKPGFDCGMRVLYIAKKENFSGNTISAFTAMFRQYNTEDMNSFSMTDLTKTPDAMPWKDPFDRKVKKMKKDYLEDYKEREFFYRPFRFDKIERYFSHPEKGGNDGFVLSSEELATLFHLPGKVAETPNFIRIESKKGEPPANLPI